MLLISIQSVDTAEVHSAFFILELLGIVLTILERDPLLDKKTILFEQVYYISSVLLPSFKINLSTVHIIQEDRLGHLINSCITGNRPLHQNEKSESGSR